MRTLLRRGRREIFCGICATGTSRRSLHGRTCGVPIRRTAAKEFPAAAPLLGLFIGCFLTCIREQDLYSEQGGLVSGAEQGFEVGEGIQAALMLFVFGKLAEGVFRAFEVGLGKLVEKTARFTVL